MKTKAILSIIDARNILDAVIAEAEKASLIVTVSVVDDGGHVLITQRMEGAVPMGPGMAEGKARTSALGRRASGTYEDQINNGRTAYLSATPVAMLRGGLPIVFEGNVIGAVGVSGAKPDQDEAIAKAGIAAVLGL